MPTEIGALVRKIAGEKGTWSDKAGLASQKPKAPFQTFIVEQLSSTVRSLIWTLEACKGLPAGAIGGTMVIHHVTSYTLYLRSAIRIVCIRQGSR